MISFDELRKKVTEHLNNKEYKEAIALLMDADQTYDAKFSDYMEVLKNLYICKAYDKILEFIKKIERYRFRHVEPNLRYCLFEYWKGVSAYGSKNHAMAILHLTSVLETIQNKQIKKPDIEAEKTATLFMLGQIYMDSSASNPENLAKAHNYFLQYLNNLPENLNSPQVTDPSCVVYACDVLGSYYSEQKRFQDAIPYFEKILKLFPKNPPTIFKLTEAYINNGQLMLAAGTILQLVNGQNLPTNTLDSIYTDLVKLGMLILSKCTAEKAAVEKLIEFFIAFIKIKPFDPALYCLLEIAAQTAGLSVKINENSTRLPKDRANTQHLLALCCVNEQRWNDAILWLERAIKSHPDYAAAYTLLITVYQNTQQFEKAADALIKARQSLTCNPQEESKLRALHKELIEKCLPDKNHNDTAWKLIKAISKDEQNYIYNLGAEYYKKGKRNIAYGIFKELNEKSKELVELLSDGELSKEEIAEFYEQHPEKKTTAPRLN